MTTPAPAEVRAPRPYDVQAELRVRLDVAAKRLASAARGEARRCRESGLKHLPSSILAEAAVAFVEARAHLREAQAAAAPRELAELRSRLAASEARHGG